MKASEPLVLELGFSVWGLGPTSVWQLGLGPGRCSSLGLLSEEIEAPPGLRCHRTAVHSGRLWRALVLEAAPWHTAPAGAASGVELK